jgi:FkbM family methyltransferase
MKQVSGIFLPDAEAHMTDYLGSSGGVYQTPQLLRSLEFVTQWDLAIDIGAHVGLWSKALVERFSRVVAFEPLAPMRACLEKNVVSKKLTVVPIALGATHGAVSFDYDESHTGATHVAAGGAGLIPLGKLDDFGLKNVGYIKIDVEGFELEALQGAERTLRDNHPIIITEDKFHGVRHFGQQPYAAIRFLESLGAAVLDRVVDDLIVGWPDSPGKVKAVAPTAAPQQFAFARRRHAAKDINGAQIAYRTLLRSFPNYAPAWDRLAVAESQCSRHASAVAAAREAVAIEPASATYLNTLGVCLCLTGQFDEARAALERAVMLEPDFCEAQVNLGEVYEKLGHASLAANCFAVALRLRPNAADLLARVGRLHAAHGPQQRAQPSFLKAVQNRPSFREIH